ncbi:uroporphyrinogen-III synthase [Ferruginibacter lapsinanis]|uniref:uroporphyrinogen-III synthase n=1 Tax=Ferruginibacter lapsinanis TaxID=563172 RepID=UPI001E60C699|nr:uroporphyrinogen-III synthase [Ferruginibacter lapsinanis]UEG48980.1 uroporphyrinogen-III synthase [Ferruginibacter lapsinanis]
MSDTKNISLISTSVIPEEVIRNAADNGVMITDTPFINVTLTRDEKAIEQIKALEDKHITAIFTSLNAITSVTNHLATKPNWQVYCMSGVSKPAVINFFGETALAGTGSNAKQLAEAAIANKPAGEVVFFCGNKRLPDLPETLASAGIPLTEVEVYHTVKTPHLLENKNYNAIAFFSPSSVESFFENNTLQPDVVAFTVGQTTANKIKQYCDNTVIISNKPGKENLVQTVIEYFNTRTI